MQFVDSRLRSINLELQRSLRLRPPYLLGVHWFPARFGLRFQGLGPIGRRRLDGIGGPVSVGPVSVGPVSGGPVSGGPVSGKVQSRGHTSFSEGECRRENAGGIVASRFWLRLVCTSHNWNRRRFWHNSARLPNTLNPQGMLRRSTEWLNRIHS